MIFLCAGAVDFVRKYISALHPIKLFHAFNFPLVWAFYLPFIGLKSILFREINSLDARTIGLWNRCPLVCVRAKAFYFLFHSPTTHPPLFIRSCGVVDSIVQKYCCAHWSWRMISRPTELLRFPSPAAFPISDPNAVSTPSLLKNIPTFTILN